MKLVDRAQENPVLSLLALKKNFAVPLMEFVGWALHTAMHTQHGRRFALIVRVILHLAVLPLDAMTVRARLNNAWEIRMGLIQYVMGNVSPVDKAKRSTHVMWREVKDAGVGTRGYRGSNLHRPVGWRWRRVLHLLHR